MTYSLSAKFDDVQLFLLVLICSFYVSVPRYWGSFVWQAYVLIVSQFDSHFSPIVKLDLLFLLFRIDVP